MKHVVLAALVVFAFTQVAGAQQKGSDLEAYIEGIRTSRISETGRSQVLSVACVCAGATILEYHKDADSGRYWPSYTSATCPKPDADPPQVVMWKKLRSSDADMLTDKLKPFADADGSGFVTTKEADDFRWLVEFGYLVQQVNRDEGTKASLIARASGLSTADVAQRVKSYDALAHRVHDAGVTELPQVSMTAD